MAQRQQRFAVLDGWRGLCALLVALYHLNVVSPFLDNGLIRHAYLFVDFFFVLSGFVITHTYWGKLTDAGALGDFTVRRFARIWPLQAALLDAFRAPPTGRPKCLIAHTVKGRGVSFMEDRASWHHGVPDGRQP